MGKTKISRPSVIETTVGDALSTAYSTLEELAGEMRDAFDNTPESLQVSAVGEARGEAADALESLTEPEPGERLGSLPVRFALPPQRRRRMSRAARRDEAVAYAQAALEALENHRDNGGEEEAAEEVERDREGRRMVYLPLADIGARLKEMFDGVNPPEEVLVRDDRGGSGEFVLLVADENSDEENKDGSTEDLDTLIDDVQMLIDEAEAVDFPGMYG